MTPKTSHMLSCFRKIAESCQRVHLVAGGREGESTAQAAAGLRREVWPRVEAVA